MAYNKNASRRDWHFDLRMYTIKQVGLSDRRFCFKWDDKTGMIAFWPLMYIKPDNLPGFERSVTIHLDGGIMSEDIFAAAFRADEPEPFGVIEPFNCTRLHASYPS